MTDGATRRTSRSRATRASRTRPPDGLGAQPAGAGDTVVTSEHTSSLHTDISDANSDL